MESAFAAQEGASYAGIAVWVARVGDFHRGASAQHQTRVGLSNLCEFATCVRD